MQVFDLLKGLESLHEY